MFSVLYWIFIFHYSEVYLHFNYHNVAKIKINSLTVASFSANFCKDAVSALKINGTASVNLDILTRLMVIRKHNVFNLRKTGHTRRRDVWSTVITFSLIFSIKVRVVHGKMFTIFKFFSIFHFQCDDPLSRRKPLC